MADVRQWAAGSSMQAGKWYTQEFKSAGQIWFLAQAPLKNGGWSGRLVRWETKNPKSISSTVPPAAASLWKPTTPPPEVAGAA